MKSFGVTEPGMALPERRRPRRQSCRDGGMHYIPPSPVASPLHFHPPWCPRGHGFRCRSLRPWFSVHGAVGDAGPAGPNAFITRPPSPVLAARVVVIPSGA